MCLVLAQCPTYKEQSEAPNPMNSRQQNSTCAYHKANRGEKGTATIILNTLASDDTLPLSYTSSVV